MHNVRVTGGCKPSAGFAYYDEYPKEIPKTKNRRRTLYTIKKARINLLNCIIPGSLSVKYSRFARNLMNEMLLEIELFIIRLGLPIASYLSGHRVPSNLNSQKHRANQTRTEHIKTVNNNGRYSFI
jgi:hypothetical protein